MSVYKDADQLCRALARMTPYRFDKLDDDQIEDALLTMNRLIEEANAIVAKQERTL